MRFSKAIIASGVAALTVAILGAILFMNHPAQSKDDNRPRPTKGVSTTLGF